MKILALNGGGMGGYRTAKFLELMEKDLGRPCWTIFDMITGVSAGSINGGMLARKMPASEIANAFRTHGPKIFGKGRWFLTQLILNKTKFDEKKLEKLVKSYTDCDIKDCAVKFMAYALKINGGSTEPKFWKSWKDEGVKLSDIIMSSSAAPTFFPPHQIDGNWYADGGLINNNPTVSSIAEAIKLGNKLENIYVLNVSNGPTAGVNPKKFKGLLQVAPKITFLTIGGDERAGEYIGHQLIGFRNHVIMPTKQVDIDSLNFGLMDQQATELYEFHKKSILDNLSKY